jgi:hypothetical protein
LLALSVNKKVAKLTTKSYLMQMQLPIFPTSTKLINNCIGVFEKNDFIYYLHNGSPIFCHGKDDLNYYRFVTGNLVNTGLCTPIEIARAFGVSNRNIQRYAKALREKGSDWFLNRDDNRGSCHKVTEEVISQAQKLIDDFYSVSDVARLLGVTEGALRYHIKKGTIKKKWSLR